jgi:hypothetical protein
MKDRADPHARERALVIARHDPPPSVSLGQNQRSRSAREKFWSTSDSRLAMDFAQLLVGAKPEITPTLGH